MMRTEVKIGISVAILLVVVVIAYVVLGRGGDTKPPGNQGDNRVAVANTPSSGLNYGNSANTANRSVNTTWGTNTASNMAVNNANNRTSIYDDIYNSNNTYTAANSASNSAWPYNGSYTSYNAANTANTAYSNTGYTGYNSAYNAAGNSAGNSVDVDWGGFDDSWNSNVASNSAGNRSSGTGGSETTASAGETRTYTVKSGDNFWSIAASQYGDGKYNTLLVDANKDVDPTKLQVGTVLKVPPLPARTGPASGGAGGVTTSADGSKVYVVAEGDTLWKIAEKMVGGGANTQAKVDALVKANPGLTASIKPGQKITLPDNATVTPGTGTSRTGTTSDTPRTASNRPVDTTTDPDRPARPRFR